MQKVFCVLLAGFLLVGCGSESVEPPFRPVADVSQLMTEIIDPAADGIWNSVGIVVDEVEGENEWFPQTDDEWAALQHAAMTVAEGGNLLMIGDRARDQDTWMRMAQDMIDAGLMAYEVAKSRDKEGIYEVSEIVYATCNSCHNLYWIGDEDRGRVRSEPRQ